MTFSVKRLIAVQNLISAKVEAGEMPFDEDDVAVMSWALGIATAHAERHNFNPLEAPMDRYMPVPRANHEIVQVRTLRVPYWRPEVEALDPDFMRTVVLVSGSVGDYTVYEGIGPAEWVRDFGNKLPFRIAEAFFPGLDERRYRE